MNVKVNSKDIRIFKGATAKDAVLRYLSTNKMDKALVEQVVVNDQWNHEIDIDAPLREGQVITFEINPVNEE